MSAHGQKPVADSEPLLCTHGLEYIGGDVVQLETKVTDQTGVPTIITGRASLNLEIAL